MVVLLAFRVQHAQLDNASATLSATSSVTPSATTAASTTATDVTHSYPSKIKVDEMKSVPQGVKESIAAEVQASLADESLKRKLKAKVRTGEQKLQYC